MSWVIAETAEDGMSEGTDEHVSPGTTWYGYMLLGAEGGVMYDGAWIFRGTGIPQGATILTATITLDEGGGDRSLPLAGDWWGFDVDSPDDFNAAHTHRISDHHTRTSANVEDNINTAGDHTSPSLVTIVQEIVDRAGFSGDIGLTWRSTATEDCWYEWSDYEDGDPAVLTVTYDAGGGGVEIFRRRREVVEAF
jgi:hypothetical protein